MTTRLKSAISIADHYGACPQMPTRYEATFAIAAAAAGSAITDLMHLIPRRAV